MVNLSIIIPCYNSEKYLERCLQSLIVQKGNYEIIIIDDGSTDNTSIILDRYSVHSNIKIFKQENKGVSSARNFGLKVAQGEYVLFVDADDFVSSNYISALESNNDKSDLLMFDFFINNKRNGNQTKLKNHNIFQTVIWGGCFKADIREKFMERICVE